MASGENQLESGLSYRRPLVVSALAAWRLSSLAKKLISQLASYSGFGEMKAASSMKAQSQE
jgi:hypothetical protein